MRDTPPARLSRIYRYPVKGLSAEPLEKTSLQVGEPLPGDRHYAIENGASGFEASAPRYFPKSYFLMLMRNERLATWQTHFDEATGLLTIRRGGEVLAEGRLETIEGRETIERFFAAHCADELRGAPKVLSGGGHSFSDVARKVLSIINLESLKAIEAMVGQPVHPLRFRANLYVEGWPGWREFDFLDQTLKVGDCRLKVVKRIVRCAAVNVDPETGARDLNLPHTLMQELGHSDCGVYAEVISAGTVRVGDTIAPAEVF